MDIKAVEQNRKSSNMLACDECSGILLYLSLDGDVLYVLWDPPLYYCKKWFNSQLQLA